MLRKDTSSRSLTPDDIEAFYQSIVAVAADEKNVGALKVLQDSFEKYLKNADPTREKLLLDQIKRLREENFFKDKIEDEIIDLLEAALKERKLPEIIKNTEVLVNIIDLKKLYSEKQSVTQPVPTVIRTGKTVTEIKMIGSPSALPSTTSTIWETLADVELKGMSAFNAKDFELAEKYFKAILDKAKWDMTRDDRVDEFIFYNELNLIAIDICRGKEFFLKDNFPAASLEFIRALDILATKPLFDNAKRFSHYRYQNYINDIFRTSLEMIEIYFKKIEELRQNGKYKKAFHLLRELVAFINDLKAERRFDLLVDEKYKSYFDSSFLEMLQEKIDMLYAFSYPVCAAARLGGAEFILSHRRHDPNVRDHEDQTPLFLAAKMGHVEVVHALLSQGADPDMLCGMQKPLFVATSPEIITMLKTAENIREEYELPLDDENKFRERAIEVCYGLLFDAYQEDSMEQPVINSIINAFRKVDDQVQLFFSVIKNCHATTPAERKWKRKLMKAVDEVYQSIIDKKDFETIQNNFLKTCKIIAKKINLPEAKLHAPSFFNKKKFSMKDVADLIATFESPKKIRTRRL